MNTIQGAACGAGIMGGTSPDAAVQKCAARNQLGVESPVEKARRILDADQAHRSLAADQVLMMNSLFNGGLSQGLGLLAEGINAWMAHQGFNNSEKGTEVALMHSELSEMLEAIRNEDRQNEVEELADTVIRILHYAGKYRLDLGLAIHQKMLKNYGRPFRHGKQF
jgi:NTP pyrophosphatase (non-canonical NTP hydrolase)